MSVQIGFENIKVFFTKREFKKKHFGTKERRQILMEISGCFRSNALTAILGPSGSGKTVFLSLLGGQQISLQKAEIEGNIYINQDKPDSFDLIQLISGFVPQDDAILSSMTVEEAIKMSAVLRTDLNAEERKQRIEWVLKKLDLVKARKTLIGNPLKRGVSGGERKRTAIGMELMANPRVMFLDEPTSGLDAYAQLNVIKILKTLASEGRTIISTLHSPSSQMLNYIDDLLVLAEGKIIYHGPTKGLVDYFHKLNFECPKYVNPADYLFLDVLYGQDGKLSENIKILSEEYKKSQLGQQSVHIMKHPPSIPLTADMLHHKSSFIKQLLFLVRRAFFNQIRNPFTIFVRFLSTLILAVFIALVFIQTARHSTAATVFVNIGGALFFSIINQFFTSFNGILHVVGEEKGVFIREYVSGYYRLPAYFISVVLIEIPFQLIFPFIYVTIIYWIIGFRPGFDHYLMALCFFILLSLNGAALGLLASTLFSAPEAAVIVGPLILLPLIIYGGFFVNTSNSPVWLSWIQWISPAQYAFTGLLQNELSGRTIDGASGEGELNMTGASSRFSMGLNVVFLVVLFFGILLLSYIGLANLVLSSGVHPRKQNKIRRKLKKGQQPVINS